MVPYCHHRIIHFLRLLHYHTYQHMYNYQLNIVLDNHSIFQISNLSILTDIKINISDNHQKDYHFHHHIIQILQLIYLHKLTNIGNLPVHIRLHKIHIFLKHKLNIQHYKSADIGYKVNLN